MERPSFWKFRDPQAVNVQESSNSKIHYGKSNKGETKVRQ